MEESVVQVQHASGRYLKSDNFGLKYVVHVTKPYVLMCEPMMNRLFCVDNSIVFKKPSFLNKWCTHKMGTWPSLTSGRGWLYKMSFEQTSSTYLLKVLKIITKFDIWVLKNKFFLQKIILSTTPPIFKIKILMHVYAIES